MRAKGFFDSPFLSLSVCVAWVKTKVEYIMFRKGTADTPTHTHAPPPYQHTHAHHHHHIRETRKKENCNTGVCRHPCTQTISSLKSNHFSFSFNFCRAVWCFFFILSVTDTRIASFRLSPCCWNVNYIWVDSFSCTWWLFCIKAYFVHSTTN